MASSPIEKFQSGYSWLFDPNPSHPPDEISDPEIVRSPSRSSSRMILRNPRFGNSHGTAHLHDFQLLPFPGSLRDPWTVLASTSAVSSNVKSLATTSRIIGQISHLTEGGNQC